MKGKIKMEVKRKLWLKVTAVFLVALMVIQILPLTVFANEMANIEALEPSLAQTEPSPVACELEEERDAFSKTYLLEDGTYATYVSNTAIHEQSSDGEWQEISEISVPETMEELQTEMSSNTAGISAYSVNFIEDSPSVTTELDGMTIQSIGNGLTGVNDDELRIQEYDTTTSQIRSVGYAKLNSLSIPELGDACIVTKATLGAYCSILPGSENNIIIAQTVEDEWPQANSQDHPLSDSIMDYNEIISSNEEYYEWDITEAACRWSNKTLENYGIALSPYDNNCKVSAYVDNIVMYYSVVNELDENYSFHSVDMGRAGTAYVNDFTNDFYLVRNELSVDGNVMPVSITRTFNNAHKNDSDIAGIGWHFNDDSSLSKVSISRVRFFKWVQEDGSIKYFESKNGSWKEQGITEDEDGTFHGYTVTENSPYNIISSVDDDYEYFYGVSSHQLEKIVDKNDKAIVFTYDDNYVLSNVTDGLGRKFNFTLGTFGDDSFVNNISVKDSSNNPIQLENKDLTLSYGYTDVNNKKRLTSVTYNDTDLDNTNSNKKVMYEYDTNGNMTVIRNIDGTSLHISYNSKGKVTSYTKFASDGETILDKLTIDSMEAYQRIFTDKNNKITRQQYDSRLNMISEITDADGYFREYDEKNELQSISVTEDHTNLLTNYDFSDGLTGWNRPSNRGVEIVTDNDNGFKLSKYDNNVIKLPGKYNAINYAKQTYHFNDDKDHTGEVYTAGVWAKVDGSIAKTDENNKSRTVGVLLNGYTNSGSGENTELLADITFDNSITDWQYMMVTFKLDKDYDGIEFALSYNYQIGKVYFDGATLYKSTQSSAGDPGPEPTCLCENCSESNCPCECESEENCNCIWCKRGTTTTENEYGLTTKETTTDAVTSMESTYTYNPDNYYLTESTDVNGNTVYYEYDANTGKLTSMAAGNENDKINYTYNAVGLLKTVSQTVTNIVTGESVNMLSEYTYDGDTLKQISHNGMTYSYEYDIYGNPASIKVNNTALAEYTYTDGGANIGSITYANGSALVYTYDNAGNILTISTASVSETGALENQILKYQYTYSNGNIATITDNISNTITRYEDNGYKTYLIGEDSSETQIYSYTATDNVSNLAYVNDGITLGISNISGDKNYNRTTGKTVYSGTSQISRNNSTNESSVSKTASTSAEVDYYNRTLSSSFGSGNNTLTNAYTYKTETDENGKTTTSNQVDSSALMLGTEAYNYSYTYDTAGRLTSKSLNNELLVSYKYDAAGQLIRENNKEIGETYLYTYDNGGNKSTSYYCEFTEAENVSVEDCTVYDTFEYNNTWKDQASKFNGTDITYDELGNMLKKGRYQSYYWEGRQLTKSRISNTRFNHYSYDANGLRTETKTANSTGTTVYADYKYVWNENTQLASQNLSVKRALNFSDSYGHRTTLGIGNYTTFIIYNELGEAVGFSIDDGTNIKVYYYMKDVTGQIDAVVDVETNTLVYSCTYDAWGYILDEYCTNALVAYGNPLRYKDYNYDIESNLYYLQSRYYDVSMCRFINADDPLLTDTALGDTLSINMYTYCANNPISNADPTGYINYNTVFSVSGIVSAVLSAIEMISIAAFKNTPWGRLVSAFIIAASVASTVASYASALKSARNYYGKNSTNYKNLIKYNSIILAAQVAFIIICDRLGKSVMKKYSATVAYCLIKARTITIVGMSINVAELLSGKSIIYRSRRY